MDASRMRWAEQRKAILVRNTDVTDICAENLFPWRRFNHSSKFVFFIEVSYPEDLHKHVELIIRIFMELGLQQYRVHHIQQRNTICLAVHLGLKLRKWPDPQRSKFFETWPWKLDHVRMVTNRKPVVIFVQLCYGCLEFDVCGHVVAV